MDLGSEATEGLAVDQGGAKILSLLSGSPLCPTSMGGPLRAPRGVPCAV